MRGLVLLLVSLVAVGPAEVRAQATPTSEAETKALHQMAAAIPLGSKVKAQTNEGKRISGTLMGRCSASDR